MRRSALATFMARFRVSFVMKVKLHRGGVLRLPAEIRRVLGLREGDELLVTVEGGAVKLLPVGLVDPWRRAPAS